MTEEYSICKFFLGNDISVRILASASVSKFTQKTIDKIIAHLNLYREDLPKRLYKKRNSKANPDNPGKSGKGEG